MQPVHYELNLETNDFKWSDEIYSVFGYERSQPVNTADWWTESIHPDDAMILNQAMDKLMDPHAQEWTVEYRFKKSDNNYVLVSDHAAIVRDSAGNAVRLVGDLTPK